MKTLKIRRRKRWHLAIEDPQSGDVRMYPLPLLESQAEELAAFVREYVPGHIRVTVGQILRENDFPAPDAICPTVV